TRAVRVSGLPGDGVRLRWLEGGAPGQLAAGCTWGVPWPEGAVPADQAFALRTATGQQVPLQTWATAYWPDGSLKWTAHALGADVPPAEQYVLAAGTSVAPATAVTVEDRRNEVEVSTGVIRCVIAKKGDHLVRALVRGDREIAPTAAAPSRRLRREIIDMRAPRGGSCDDGDVHLFNRLQELDRSISSGSCQYSRTSTGCGYLRPNSGRSTAGTLAPTGATWVI
ncbi:hypothetical protein K7G98_30660, partial [Saccharothrix sp. MB29]|nr:hypothetical protein [Saccharothrix sp. MB29]